MTTEEVDADRWEGERVTRWLRQVEGIERQLSPWSERLFAAAQLQPGERVLDVGCGSGPTTRRAALEVGRSGHVTGLDVAAEMLTAAAAVGAEASAAPIDWVEADATAWTPGGDPFDAVISRFGVMFFDDPHRAFANLAGLARPSARFVAAVWATRDESDLFALPLSVAAANLESQGHQVTLPPVDVGPFSLGTPAVTADVLAGSGWEDVTWTRHRQPLLFNGGVGPEEAAQGCLEFGPTRKLLGDYGTTAADTAVAAIAAAFDDHVNADGHVVLDGTIGIVTARRR